MLSKQKSVIENGRHAEELPNNNTDDSTEYACYNDTEHSWIHPLLLPICLLLLLYSLFVTLTNAGYLKRKESSDNLCSVLVIRVCAQGA
jgi:hypothetical protein